MRAREFIREADDSTQGQGTDPALVDTYSDLIMVLNQIQSKIKEKKLDPTISLSDLVRYVQDEGLDGFNINSFKEANEKVPAIKNIIKNIEGNDETGTVTFVTDQPDSVSNPEDMTKAVNSPEKTVSSMAKKAMKKRI